MKSISKFYFIDDIKKNSTNSEEEDYKIHFSRFLIKKIAVALEILINSNIRIAGNHHNP
jgi:hypothetical protein